MLSENNPFKISLELTFFKAVNKSFNKIIVDFWSDDIHEISVAMGFGASSEDVARICHGHPTVNEAIKEAALATYSKAIHS